MMQAVQQMIAVTARSFDFVSTNIYLHLRVSIDTSREGDSKLQDWGEYSGWNETEAWDSDKRASINLSRYISASILLSSLSCQQRREREKS